MIILIARMLNEERFIERFIRQYSPIVDRILLADGGSTDRSIELASKFDKAEIRDFPVRLPCPNDESLWMNPENEHFNFVHDWAKSYNPEWIIYDDVDCVPNYLLKRHGRALLDSLGPFYHEVMVYRLYMWGKDKYFPKLNNPGQSPWAWRPSSHYEYRGNTELEVIDLIGYPNSVEAWCHKFHADHPLCLLHKCWPDKQAVEEKMKRYAAWDMPQKWPTHKDSGCGKLVKLPEWAREEENYSYKPKDFRAAMIGLLMDRIKRG